MRPNQDVLLGLFFAVIGIGAGLVSLDYPFGTLGRMGPGFFPLVIAVLLTLTAMGVLVRARLGGSAEVEATSWRPVIIVPLVVVLFGLLIEGLGLPLAVFMLLLGTAMASEKFELSAKATAGAAAFALVCAIVFIKLLGLPIPLAGSWLPFAD